MPVALLLQEVLGPLLCDPRRGIPFATLALDRQRLGLTRLAPFNRLVALEETLIGRARSAFLVHWFGTRIPFEGLAVLSFIINIDHLRRRYQAVRAAASPEDRGLNLTEPLMGLVGAAAGILLSPGGVLTLAAAVRRIPGWLRGLLFGLGWAVVPAIGLLAAALFTPAGFAAGLLVAARDEQPVRAVHDVLGAVARLFHQAIQSVDLLLGPREQIRNPLLRQILGVADRLARLIPLALALVSLMLARLGPQLLPLARQGAELLRLTRAVMAAVGDILGAIPGVLGEAFDLRRGAPLRRLLGAIQGIGPVLTRTTARFDLLFERMHAFLPMLGMRVLDALRTWFGAAQATVETELRTQRVMVTLGLLRAQLADLGRLFASSTSSPSRPSSGSSSSGPPIPGWISSGLDLFFGPPPSLPSMALPDLAAIQAMVPRPGLALDAAGIERAASMVPAALLEPLQLSAAARASFDRAAAPPVQLARARRELERELGGTRGEVLARIRTEELPLREALAAVVARVAPPEIRAYLPDLLVLFQTLDEEVYGAATAPRPPAFPVLEVKESRRLRVVVRALSVRALGGDEAHARMFRERLVEALGRQEYLAPAGP
jgi:hypothetical protein